MLPALGETGTPTTPQDQRRASTPGRLTRPDSSAPTMGSRPEAKRAHPGQQVLGDDNEGAKRRFIERTQGRSVSERQAAANMDMDNTKSDRVPDRSDATVQHAARESVPPKRLERGLAERCAPLRGAKPSVSQRPCKPPEVTQAYHLHPGSSKPHAPAEQQAEHQRADRAAPSGSLRQLEPESEERLRVKPFPTCNIPKRTDPEDPPERIANPPGPFTTAELIPDGVVPRVAAHGQAVSALLKRARRGKNGWKVARRLRPEALILEEHEALNPCGRGYVWRKRVDADLWDAVQPSSWPDDTPDTSIKVKEFCAMAKEYGLTDKQLVSWAMHGFPGPKMPNRAVIGFPHVGALKHAGAFEEKNQKDIMNGFVSHGHEFPEFWPCVCDPMNLVVQNGGTRATIDKTMKLSSSDHPEPVESYNDHIDLDAERAEVGGLSLPTTSVFGTGAAVLLTCGLRVKGGKFDLSTYYRMWGKQRASVHLSGRVLETLFGHDFRVNFGERDAPDHCCRGSDALTFFIRTELRRLDKEYPCKVPGVVAWLAMRMGLAREAGEADDPLFRWALLSFVIYYIDDAGLAVICDGPLCNTKGEPKVEIVTRGDGSQVKIHLERPEFYYTAAMAIVERTGQKAPVTKQDPMSYRFELLGIDVDLDVQRLLLTRIKRWSYQAMLREVRSGKQRLENGLAVCEHDQINSLVHKLNFASAVIVTGRQHLFYLRKAIKAPNRLEWHAVIIDTKADGELEWWDAQLEHSDDHGVPLATRSDFPCSSDSNIVRYSDASREEKAPRNSGFGAWAVIRDVFVYLFGRWTLAEIKAFSINVLEAHAKDMSGVTIIEYAKSIGCNVTHTMAYVDNSTAEHVAERGRTRSDPLHELNLQRQEWLRREGIVETTERVASIDNDVADALSRLDVEEALRYPRAAGLRVLELQVDPERRKTSHLTPTWMAESEPPPAPSQAAARRLVDDGASRGPRAAPPASGA